MGSTYSTGPLPNKLFKYLINLELVVVRGKVFRFERSIDRNYDDVLFISKKQLQWVLKLTEKQTYVLYQRFNTYDRPKLPALEIWGAMALCASAEIPEKVGFIFSLMDFSRNHHLSRIDLEILITVVTKGLSKFKGIHSPPEKTISRIVSELFAYEEAIFNEHGEIFVQSVQEFMVTNDLCRTYFSSIGTQATTQDLNKLIDQRSDVMKELVDLKAELDNFLIKTTHLANENDAYLRERGGDIDYIKIDEQMLAKLSDTANLNTNALFEDDGMGGTKFYETEQHHEKSHKGSYSGSNVSEISDEQRLRRLHRQKALAGEKQVENFLQDEESVAESLSQAGTETDKKSVEEMLDDSEMQAYKKKHKRTTNEILLQSVEDANIFAHGCKGGISGGSGGSSSGIYSVDTVLEQAILYKWESTIAQCDDKLSCIDIDIVEDLFESGGVLLSDREAQHCVDHVPTNDLNRVCVHDIIQWYKDYKLNIPLHSVPEWYTAGRNISATLTSWEQNFVQTAESLEIQKGIIDEIKRIGSELKRIGEDEQENAARFAVLQGTDDTGDDLDADRSMSISRLNSTISRMNSLESRPVSPGEEIQKDVQRPSSVMDKMRENSRNTNSRGVNATNNLSILGELKGSVRLAAWQRQRILDVPTKIDANIVFGDISDAAALSALQNGRGGSNSRTATANDISKFQAAEKMGNLDSKGKVEKSEKMVKMLERLKEEALKEEALDSKYKTKINFDIFAHPEVREKDRPDMFQVNEQGILTTYEEWTPGDILRKYKFMKETLIGEEEEAYGSVFWYTVRVKESATDEEVHCLYQTAINFWNSIPVDYRCNTYTHVAGDIFYLTKEYTVEEMFGGDEVKAMKPYPRIILIVLLHETDFYRDFESKLPSGVLITRALRNFNFDLKLTSSLKEIYESALPFENYEDRIYGPQEDELGEDGMNPLKFAKMCRQRQKAVREAAATVDEMSFDELKEHLKMRGLKATGTLGELTTRTKAAFEKQASLIGFGELSVFGEAMIDAIFHRFCTHVPKNSHVEQGLTFWDFNELLRQTKTRCLYDHAEYTSVMQDHLELLCNSNGELTQAGLQAYYERVGRLARDIKTLGIGSANEVLNGIISIKGEYDADAIGSLFKLTEDHCHAQLLIKQVLLFVSSLSDLSSEMEFQTLGDCFSLLNCGSNSNTDGMIPSRAPLVPYNEQYIVTLWDALQSWFRKNRPPSRAQEAVGIPPIPTEIPKTASTNAGSAGSVRPNTTGDKQGDSSLHNTNDVPDTNQALDNNWFASFRDLLTTPGYVAKFLHSLIEALGNRNYGIIRSLRLSALEYFGRYDAWEELYRDTFGVQSRPSTAASSRPVTAGSRPVTAGSISSESTSSNAVSEPVLGPTHAMVAEWTEKLADILPPNENTRDIDHHIKCLCRDIEEIQHRLQSIEERITRNQREILRKTKISKEKELVALIQKLNGSVKLFTAHATAYYDAFRLYGDSVDYIGLGTKECGLKVSLKGLDFMSFLPPAMGEASISNRLKQEKLQRSIRRKNGALAAMEREKLRRNMDAKTREKLRLQQEEKKRKARILEEQTIFGEGYVALQSYLEEVDKANVTAHEITELVNSFRTLYGLVENRYPNSLKLIVLQNDLAVVLLETCYKITDRRNEAFELLTMASQSVMKAIETKKSEIRLEAQKKKDAEDAIMQAAADAERERQRKIEMEELEIRLEKERLADEEAAKEKLLIEEEKKIERANIKQQRKLNKSGGSHSTDGTLSKKTKKLAPLPPSTRINQIERTTTSDSLASYNKGIGSNISGLGDSGSVGIASQSSISNTSMVSNKMLLPPPQTTRKQASNMSISSVISSISSRFGFGKKSGSSSALLAPLSAAPETELRSNILDSINNSTSMDDQSRSNGKKRKKMKKRDKSNGSCDLDSVNSVESGISTSSLPSNTPSILPSIPPGKGNSDSKPPELGKTKAMVSFNMTASYAPPIVEYSARGEASVSIDSASVGEAEEVGDNGGSMLDIGLNMLAHSTDTSDQQSQSFGVTKSYVSQNSETTNVSGISLYSQIICNTDLKLSTNVLFIYILVLQNYLSFVREVRNEQMLYQAKKIKETIYELMSLLTLKERNKAHLEKSVDHFILLAYNSTNCSSISVNVLVTSEVDSDDEEEEGPPKVETKKITIKSNMRDQLKFTMKEQHEVVTSDIRKKEAAALKKSKAAEIARLKQEQLDADREERLKEQRYWDSLDPKVAKKLKYEKQREMDAKLRAKTSKQRQKLYRLIQSDEISKIFAEQAGFGDIKQKMSGNGQDGNEEGGLDDQSSMFTKDSQYVDILADSEDEEDDGNTTGNAADDHSAITFDSGR